MDLPQHLIQLLLQDIMQIWTRLNILYSFSCRTLCRYGLASTSYTASPEGHYVDMDLPQHLIKLLLQDIMQIWTRLNILYSFSCRTLCRYGLASTSYKASPVGHYTCRYGLASTSYKASPVGHYTCRYGLASTSYKASPVGHYVDMDLPQHLIKLLLQDIIHVDMDLPQHLIKLLLQDIMQIWTCLNILYSFSCRTLCRYGLASTSYTASPVGHCVDMDLPQHLIKLLLQDIMQIWTRLNIL